MTELKKTSVFAFSLCIPLYIGIPAESKVSGCFQLSAKSHPETLLAPFLMNRSGFSSD
ncbi:MAG: hypothetical protein LKI29_08265 [Bacteroides sp.]|jgi:hypothetical protein|nr:hypothetical protein [Bacteroides sp.]